MGHQHLVCGFHLAGPGRVAFLGDMVVIHGTAVVAKVAQYLSPRSTVKCDISMLRAGCLDLQHVA